MRKRSGRPLPNTTDAIITLLKRDLRFLDKQGNCLHLRHENSSKIVPTATHAYMHTCTCTYTTSTKRHGHCFHMRHDSSSNIVPTAATITHAYMHTCTCTYTTSTKGLCNRLGCSGKQLRQVRQDSSNPRTHACMHTCTRTCTKRHGIFLMV